MTTIDQARAAKDKLAKQLMGSFNGAASPVNSVGLSQDQAGYYVAVGLERQPTAAEDAKLPKKYDGVTVKYSVNGPISAF
ncbi:MAG: hypothetical protein Q8K65_04175 [Alphaproteobacteria bacterium]|nr:hypothetical protein [Alphaproteobacteria bacterium]